MLRTVRRVAAWGGPRYIVLHRLPLDGVAFAPVASAAVPRGVQPFPTRSSTLARPPPLASAALAAAVAVRPCRRCRGGDRVQQRVLPPRLSAAESAALRQAFRRPTSGSSWPASPSCSSGRNGAWPRPRAECRVADSRAAVNSCAPTETVSGAAADPRGGSVEGARRPVQRPRGRAGLPGGAAARRRPAPPLAGMLRSPWPATARHAGRVPADRARQARSAARQRAAAAGLQAAPDHGAGAGPGGGPASGHARDPGALSACGYSGA